MRPEQVETAYARWAPIYDWSFGKLTSVARRRTMEYVSGRDGSVLEVGVGTGLSLGLYPEGRPVTGIDYSADMLARAQDKAAQGNLPVTPELHRMDARDMDFPDDHFDTVLAMHVLSVVPEPHRVMAEMTRVCRPGGEIVVANHFARETGLLHLAERAISSIPGTVGWHSDFEREIVTEAPGLRVAHYEPLPPLGVMTLVVLEKPVPEVKLPEASPCAAEAVAEPIA
ncbi:methyltransferase domain-containing protein [Dinoroseobacter sp. PD6]|uniref:class I SAM-dependent methyltransferase n=1 Tax=Dinoroseobacter sp. PD6 TaxID=3028384 RepID=UPI00237B7A9A|nr:class I SAM-dependent methyltransferase [Dinoroseobacter sp. PD6]MDD9717592.1 methyltransferase domain-containing protein [Dinoroseobacter sp. PD6]